MHSNTEWYSDCSKILFLSHLDIHPFYNGWATFIIKTLKSKIFKIQLFKIPKTNCHIQYVQFKLRLNQLFKCIWQKTVTELHVWIWLQYFLSYCSGCFSSNSPVPPLTTFPTTRQADGDTSWSCDPERGKKKLREQRWLWGWREWTVTGNPQMRQLSWVTVINLHWIHKG